MKTSSIASLMAAIPATLAAKAYIPYAYNTSAPEIHGKPVVAHNGWFYLNTTTTATCADWDPNCESQNTTIISGPTGSNPIQGGWWMGILEEGGQGIFVDGIGMPYGGKTLGYAAAKSNSYLPLAGSGATLKLDNTTIPGKLILHQTAPDDFVLNWSACPLDATDGSLAIRTGGRQNSDDYTDECFYFQMVIEETEAPAPRFYNCDGCEARCACRYPNCCDATCFPPFCGSGN